MTGKTPLANSRMPAEHANNNRVKEDLARFNKSVLGALRHDQAFEACWEDKRVETECDIYTGDMCSYTKFVWHCGHDATQAFRDGVCCRPASSRCIPRRNEVVHPYDCRNCMREMKTHIDPAAVDRELRELDTKCEEFEESSCNGVWHIPSRCFIDPGMQRLDPFAADRIKQRFEQQQNVIPETFGTRGIVRSKLLILKRRMGMKMPSRIIHFHIPAAPCCQSQKFRGLDVNKFTKNRQSDDRCVSGF